MSAANNFIVISVYRPPNDDEAYAHAFANTITDICNKYPKDTIWVGGDMNLPDIDWEENTITGNQYKKVINELLKSTIDDAGVEQVVNFPTRGQNIRDIFATSTPFLVTTCKPKIGVSDHERVYVESRVYAKYQRPIQHKIYLWKKVDIINLKAYCLRFC